MSAQMKTISFKNKTIVAALLGCSALSAPLMAQASTAVAKTSWAVSRVASESMGSYCTMAQKYSDDTVLTFARNTKDEFSLALDFKDQKFKAGKKQDVSISVDGGKAKTFSVTPQSDKTAVVTIGKDQSFIDKISGAGKLAITVDKSSSEFGLSEFASGQKEMGICIDALTNPAPMPAAKQPSEERVASLAKVEAAAGQEPSVEGLLAAMPQPSSDIKVEENIVPLEPIAPKIKQKNSADESALAELKVENAKLTRALAEQRKAFEEKQASADSSALNELNAKLQAASVENQSLRAQLDKLANTKANDKSSPEIAKLNDAVKALEQENQTLKNQLQIYASAKDSKAAVADNSEILSKVQLENADLKQQIADLKAAQKNVQVASNSDAADDEVIKLRNSLRQLNGELEVAKAENETLKKQANAFQKDLEGKQLKMAGGSWDLEQATRRYQESQREIVRLGAMIQSQEAECAKEKKDIEYMLFDPAIATKAQIAMLNSMEDQVKDKDAQLQKSETELAALKAKASPDKDAKIAELQKSIEQTKSELADKAKLLADAQAKVQQTQVAQQVELAGKEQALASMKAELADKVKQLADAQAKVQQAQVAQQADIASKEQTLASLKADSADKAKQLADAQAKIQQAQAVQAELAQKSVQLVEAQAKLQQLTSSQTLASANKDKEIDAMKTKLAQVEGELAAERIKVQDVSAKAQSQQNAQQAAAMAALQLQVQQANQKIIQLQNQIASTQSASAAAAMRAASMAPAAASDMDVMPQQAAIENVAYASPQPNVVKFKSAQDLSSLLSSAGISVRGGIKQVPGGDVTTYRAYSWKTDSLDGSAELKKVADESQFDQAVNEYLSRAKSRCSGEFAAVPSPTKAANLDASKAYEIACVGQSSSGSASVLFTYSDHVVTSIAHEGRAEAMDLAIDARDKLSSKIN